MNRKNEQGIALVITLFLMASLSALAVSLMFLSQTETSASRNYKTMSQARYAGEAGVHKAMNYLMSTAYTNTVNTALFSGLTTSSVPVKNSGNDVILSSVVADSNYPDTAVKTAFAAAAQGTLAAGTATLSYSATAKLLTMAPVNVYGGGTKYIQTWEITATGTVPGAMPATVQVSAILERDVVDAQTFAVFATGTGCAAISLGGNVTTKSYDSSVGTTTTNSGGNVGTNGNLDIGGHVDVHGSLSTPRTGIGTCVNGSNVTALTTNGAATVDPTPPATTGPPNLVTLPQALNFDLPALPSPMPPVGGQSTCAQIIAGVFPPQFPPALCTTSGGTITIDPGAATIRLGDLSGNFVLKGGNYSINSIGAGNLAVGTSGSSGQSNVVINLAGKTSTGGNLATVFDLNAQNIVNSSMDPARMQIQYAGSGAIEMTGGSNGAFMLYAPNASVTTHGNSDIWGSILARQITSSGTPAFIYDRHLQSQFFMMGNFVMSSFSWKKY